MLSWGALQAHSLPDLVTELKGQSLALSSADLRVRPSAGMEIMAEDVLAEMGLIMAGTITQEADIIIPIRQHIPQQPIADLTIARAIRNLIIDQAILNLIIAQAIRRLIMAEVPEHHLISI